MAADIERGCPGGLAGVRHCPREMLKWDLELRKDTAGEFVGELAVMNTDTLTGQALVVQYYDDGRHCQAKLPGLGFEPVGLAVSVVVDYAAADFGGSADSVAWLLGVSEGPVHLVK